MVKKAAKSSRLNRRCSLIPYHLRMLPSRDGVSIERVPALPCRCVGELGQIVVDVMFVLVGGYWCPASIFLFDNLK